MSLLTLLHHRSVRYLSGRFRFPTTQAAPLGTHTESGALGTLVFTDAGSTLATAGSRLRASGTASGANTGYFGTTMPRAAGKGSRTSFGHLVGTGLLRLGWNTALGGTTNEGFNMVNATVPTSLAVWCLNERSPTLTVPASPTDMWTILRGTGAHHIVGGKRVWVSKTDAAATLGPQLWMAAGQLPDFSIMETEVIDLGGVWATDHGPASLYSASPVAGDTGTVAADSWLEFTWTPASAETLSIEFRRTDANNLWRLDCAQTGGTIKLYERVAGVDTERAAGNTQTWTAAAVYRIIIVTDGASIAVYVALAPNGSLQTYALKNSYASATSNQTATGIRVSGFATGANLEAFPVYETRLPMRVNYPLQNMTAIGDSKSTGATWVAPFLTRVRDATTGVWQEAPLRLSASGRSNFSTRTFIDAWLAAATDTPAFVVFYLGVNDVNGDSADVLRDGTGVLWKADVAYNLDAVHTKWPSATVYVRKVGKAGDATIDSKLLTLDDTLMPAVLSTRPWAVFIGDDRLSVSIEGGDDYATRTTDGIHPTTAGYLLIALEEKAGIGL